MGQQEKKLEVVKSNDDNESAAADLGGFNRAAYNRMNSWLRIDQTLYLQHRLLDFDLVLAAERAPSSCQHGVD